MVGVQGVGAFLNRRNARGRRRGGSAGAASRLLGTQAGKQTESGEGQSEHWEHPEESIVCRLQWHFGLIARDLLVHNYNNVLADHPVVGLITLGTPNWGYPYIPADATVRCPAQVQDMNGGWNPYVNDPSTAFLSPFLTSLKQGWSSSSYGGYWFAAAGTNCPNPFRVGASASLLRRRAASTPPQEDPSIRTMMASCVATAPSTRQTPAHACI